MKRQLQVLLPLVLNVFLLAQGCENGTPKAQAHHSGGQEADHWEWRQGPYRIYEMDSDGDGTRDVFCVEKRGRLLVRLWDANNDGATDGWDHFENGAYPIPSITSSDKDFDGDVDERSFMFSDEATGTKTTFVDLDCNGVVDVQMAPPGTDRAGKFDVLFKGEWRSLVVKNDRKGIWLDEEWVEIEFDRESGKWERLLQ
jgi:hypothetical protein